MAMSKKTELVLHRELSGWETGVLRCCEKSIDHMGSEPIVVSPGCKD